MKDKNSISPLSKILKLIYDFLLYCKELIISISFVEKIILLISLMGCFTVIKSEYDNSWEGKVILTIFTFIASWIMSKISSNIELKEQQRKFATIFYRHSKNLSTKMDLSVDKYRCILESECEKKDSCIYYNNMDEIIEDILIFKNDTEENIEDISLHIANDIRSLKKIEEYDLKIETQNKKLQDENTNDLCLLKNDLVNLNNERELEFEKISKELQIHYINRKKRYDDLMKIINFRESKMHNKKNEGIHSQFKNIFEKCEKDKNTNISEVN